MPTALGTIASQRSVIPTTGLVGWYDAADTSTFRFTSGNVVYDWSDKSGTGGPMNTSGDTANHPTRSGTQNGHPTVVFNGHANGYLRRLPPWPTGGDNLTIIVAAKETGGGGHRALLMNGAYYGYTLALRGPTAAKVSVYENNVAWCESSVPSVIGAPVTYALQKTAGTWSLHRDGVNLALTNPTQPNVDPSNDCWLGGDPTNTFAGEVYEVLIYAKALSTQERQWVESYLTTKWIAPAAPIPTSGLVGWWDADDASTFDYSTAPAVAQWRDKSGNSRHLSAFVTNLSRNGTLNGRTTVMGKGNGYLGTPQWAMSQPFTMFAVARLTTAGQPQSSAITLYPDSRIYATSGTNYVAIWNSSAGFNHATAQWGTGAHVVAALFNGASSSIIVDGGSATVGTVSIPPAVSGGNLVIPGPENWVGDLAEFIVYDKALSTVERQQVETYVRTKWGTP
jgi:hypothetical protein